LGRVRNIDLTIPYPIFRIDHFQLIAFVIATFHPFDLTDHIANMDAENDLNLLRRGINRILFNDWDPIGGVNDCAPIER
jgi:hypothetical protein